MEIFKKLKQELLTINEDILSMLSESRMISGSADSSFESWETTCSRIKEEIGMELARVAVVGTIKSGKSTFINSLLKGDHLKRGAGVVTSLVTKIHYGEKLKAILYFKSWDEVNADIEQALILFPSLSWRSENERFDIRRKSDREELQHALETLTSEQLITNDTRNINSVLLSSYLEGYENVKEVVSSDLLTCSFEGEDFSKHRDYVGNEILAVYVKDIRLEIGLDIGGGDIEIADCQGSDSPNPIHLAQVQDYLIQANMIIYVVSSRTGIRQADIRFLSMIKKMGIMDNMIFVINCDFNEHESLDDLKKLLLKVKDELGLIKPDPELYSFSSLYNLFSSIKTEELHPKDKLKFEQWNQDESLLSFSIEENKRFMSVFQDMLTGHRYSLLLKNHISKLSIIGGGVHNWIGIHKDILSGDSYGAREVVEKIKIHQSKMDQIKSLIRSTLDGAAETLRKELKHDIDDFFDVRSGKVYSEINDFIKKYTPNYDDYEENLKISGFTNTLYLVYQDFRQNLDSYMTESVNPKILSFVREKEDYVKSFLESVAGPYNTMVQDALAEYSVAMEELGISLSLDNLRATVESREIDSIRMMAGLKIPSAGIITNYSAKIRTEAVVKFGFHKGLGFLRRMLKKPAANENEGIVALKTGIRRMKRETEIAVESHFRDYKETVRFQYIYKIVDAITNELFESLFDQFQLYLSDLSEIMDAVNKQCIDKEVVAGKLELMEAASAKLIGRIDSVRSEVDALIN